MDDRAVSGSKVELPSLGLLYKGKIPDGELIVSPMGTREEKMLMGGGGAHSNLIDMLISRCVYTISGESLEVPPDDLLVGDRFFLLAAIRAVSFGQDYEFLLRCTCKQQFKHTIRIPDDLETIFLDEAFEEPFEIELPVSKIKMGLRLLRGGDEKAITKYANKQYESVDVTKEGDPAYTYRMIRHIEYMILPDEDETRIDNPEIQENPDIRPAMRKRIVEHMIRIYEGPPGERGKGLVAKDTRVIRDALSKHDCGLNTTIEYTCPRCKNSSTVLMPMEIEFFRPGGDTGVRYL